MSRQVVGSMSGWSGMLKDLFRQFDDGSLTLPQAKAFTEHRNPFFAIDVPALLARWQTFYKTRFGRNLDFSKLSVPPHQEGFDRLLVVAQGMTPQLLYNKCAELFPCWKWTDKNLDEIVQSVRTAKNGHYAVWVRDRQEADEELRGLSANVLTQQGISGVTLEERKLHELIYFDETGDHLDIENWTLCSGSRCSGGCVPRARWSGGWFRVHWRGSGGADDYLRARAVVS